VTLDSGLLFEPPCMLYKLKETPLCHWHGKTRLLRRARSWLWGPVYFKFRGRYAYADLNDALRSPLGLRLLYRPK